MNLDRAGLPFIVGALAPAVALVLLGHLVWAAPFVALALFLAYFFRDPERQSPVDERVVLSPADGRVMVAGTPEPGAAPPGEWQQISIFLSPMDVHINRAPFGGRISRVEMRPGRFLPAYKPESGTKNEHTEIWIERNGVAIVCRQIVGILARRIVCRVEPGAQIAAGDRIGLMKFGSRMDVFVPMTATILVRVGEHVRGGETPIARLVDPAVVRS
jgi:phosphatidylserine decarboxylase